MTKSLTDFERWVLEQKGTEAPFSGEYVHTSEKGAYHCRKCDALLYRSDDKFPSHCGWPSFDDEIVGAVKRVPDEDGRRTEIVCEACGGHLGHIFEGEGFTPKNIRHCVNSVSLVFRASPLVKTERALFASGCFWGTEYHFAKAPGVISTRVGYCGGDIESPSYLQVCSGRTGHLECIEVLYTTERTSFESLAKLFFETHDFSQENGQGPDIGPQYLSAVFALDKEQRATVERLISVLREKGHKVATSIRGQSPFWPAEDDHQKYYFRNAKTPYCHVYRKIF